MVILKIIMRQNLPKISMVFVIQFVIQKVTKIVRLALVKVCIQLSEDFGA